MRTDKIKTGLAALFLLLLAAGFLANGPRGLLLRTGSLLKGTLSGRETAGVSAIEETMAETLWGRRALLDLNGWMMKELDMRGYYGDIGIYIDDGEYIVSAYDATTTDYEVEQMTDFRDFLAENGVKLLYVCKPGKYLDDTELLDAFGVESFSNRNADRLVERLRAADIPVVDLRESIRDEGLDVRTLFYRTDHHWTTRAGLWATRLIGEGLNDSCGYAIDTSVWNEENFLQRDWEQCWLGEQGRKVGAAYVGLDDYTEIKPAFSTDYLFRFQGETYDGDFGVFIDEAVYDTSRDVYDSPSWHYSYNRTDCVNRDVAEGKVLLLGDSYDFVTVPFLSLGVHALDSLILRYYGDDFDLRQHILDEGYDTVIVCYAPLMIGAHDDPASFNYRMFTFS